MKKRGKPPLGKQRLSAEEELDQKLNITDEVRSILMSEAGDIPIGDPDQMNEIFQELEMKNLFLIQQKQETDEQYEKKEKELEEVKAKYHEQEDRCKRQMDEIQ